VPRAGEGVEQLAAGADRAAEARVAADDEAEGDL
jgi:hypothetical protein